ncbi:MAG: HlyD family efflux transporter periplasmic adaptor subunit [Angelakisella sp.]
MKSGMGKLLTFIMAAFLLVFAGYHAYRHFFSDYTTENVYRYTVYHSTTAQGVFFREEKSLDQSAGSNLRYAVRDGEKVRVGSVLAYRYSDALSADLAERRAEAQKELTMLQRVLAQLQSSNTPTVSDLTRNTDIDLQKLAEAVALEHYSGMDTLALNLQEEINLGSGITGKTVVLEARIAELEAQTSGSASGEAVYSTLEGYFSSAVDGREGEYTPARLEAMSCDDLQTLLTAGETEEAGLGKVVSGPEWYFALTISSKEHKNYQLGSRVNLAFAGEAQHRARWCAPSFPMTAAP